MNDWQNVFTLIGILAVFVVPFLGLYIRELEQRCKRLETALHAPAVAQAQAELDRQNQAKLDEWRNRS